MTPRLRPSLPLLAALTLSTAVTLSVATSSAQQVPADAPAAASEDGFKFEIGHAAKRGAVYAVEATQPATSRLTGQKVRLKVIETTGFDRTFHYFTLATGKHKTVAELDAVLVDVFHRFLAEPAPAQGQELGKIGDVQHGGEVRFVVTSASILRFDNIAPGQPVHTSNYSREDVAGLLAALTGQPAL